MHKVNVRVDFLTCLNFTIYFHLPLQQTCIIPIFYTWEVFSPEKRNTCHVHIIEQILDYNFYIRIKSEFP